jgi:hypothetical protein
MTDHKGEAEMNVSMEAIIVRQVSALVAALAEVIHDDPKQQLELEAYLYRILTLNCGNKAKMAEELGRVQSRRRSGSSGSKKSSNSPNFGANET